MKKSKTIEYIIAIAVVKALIVGLIVPLSTVSLVLLAFFLFEGLHVFIRAFLMILCGLAGLSLGIITTLKLLNRMGLNLQRKIKEIRN